MPSSPPAELGRAMNLVYVNADGKMEVSPEAVECLRGVKEKVSVVSVLGRFRGGKSSLLARLIGADRRSFEVSPSVQACTKGVRMYTPPLSISGGRKLILMDTEGLMAPDSDIAHDTRVFAVAILLSSAFVYNVTGTIDETTLSTLRVVTQFASLMLAADDAKEGERPTAEQYGDLAGDMPQFNMLVRDFALTLESADGRAMSPTEWLEETLSTEVAAKSRGLDNLDDKLEVRRAIKSLFPVRRCFTLPRPTGNEAVLARMDVARDEDLNPDFVAGIREIKRSVLDAAPAKTVIGEPVTGEGLLAIAQHLVDRVNSGAAPRIRDSWALLAELRDRDAADRAMQHMRAATATWSDVEMSLADLQRALTKIGAETQRRYVDELTAAGAQPTAETRQRLAEVDIPARIQEIMDGAVRRATSQIQGRIDGALAQMRRVEAEMAREANQEEASGGRLRELWTELVNCAAAARSEVGKALADLETVGTAGSQLCDALEAAQFESVRTAGSCLADRLVAVEEEGRGGGARRAAELEAMLADARSALQCAEDEARDAIDRVRSEAEDEVERRLTESREARAAQHDELQRQLQGMSEERAGAVKEVALLRSENEALKREAAEQLESAPPAAAVAEEEGGGYMQTIESLKGQLEDLRFRFEQVENEANDLRTERSGSKLELQAALDAAKKHADSVIAAHEQSCARQVAESARGKASAEQAAAQDRLALDKLKQESQRMIATLTARLESLQNEVEAQRQHLEQARSQARDSRREERESLQRIQNQLSEVRQQHQADCDRREAEHQRQISAHFETRAELERRVAHLSGLNENGKREMDQLKDVAQENKRLRQELQKRQHEQSRAEAESIVIKERLTNKEREMTSMAGKLSQSSTELDRVNIQLAIEKYKNEAASLSLPKPLATTTAGPATKGE